MTTQVSVESRCSACNRREPVGVVKGRMVHSQRDNDGRAIPDGFFRCFNFDTECRHAAEPFGLYTFAWWPVKCRNGRRRWLRWIEQHDDGTFTLGDRAH